MTKPRGKRQTQGPLKDHYKDGKVFRPLMVAYEVTRAYDWVKDDLPDLLWPAILASRLGSDGAAAFRRVQEAVIEAVGPNALESGDIDFDGRLSSIEAIPDDMRPPLVSLVREADWVELAMVPDLRSVLQLYEGAPAAWLLVEPFRDADPTPPNDAPDYLLRVIVGVLCDPHLNAIVKCAPLGWLLLRGKLSIDPKMVEVLRDYPSNLSSRDMADTMIRASFGSQKGAAEAKDPAHFQRAQAWGRSFWNQNWRMFACHPEELRASRQPDDTQSITVDAEDHRSTTPSDSGRSRHDAEPLISNQLDESSPGMVERVISMFEVFLEEAMNNQKEIDLYSPAKHEVICGFVSRAARAVFATLRAPHLWSGEHGMSTMRILSETKITLMWMSQQAPSIYEQYRNYGRGKAKLMKKHMEDLARSFPDEPPAELTEALEHFEKRLGGEWGQQLQDVSLDSTFSGLSVRQMAADVGLADEYRHVYQPASSIAHGEWWTIEDYAMQRCLNPLHRFHRIPSFDLEFPTTEKFGDLLADKLSALIELAIQMLA